MSSTNKTANLNLHSWVRTDPVVCDDFNDNFTKIDTAVGNLSTTRGNCEIYSGSYTGTGSKIHSLTFPKLPVLLSIQYDTFSSHFYSTIVFDGGTFVGPSSSQAYAVMSVSGTTVTFNEIGSGNSVVFNRSGATFRYVALAPAQ